MDHQVVILTLTDAGIAKRLSDELEASGIPAATEKIQFNSRGKMLAAAYRLFVPASLRKEAYRIVRNNSKAIRAPVPAHSWQAVVR